MGNAGQYNGPKMTEGNGAFDVGAADEATSDVGK